MSILKSRRFLPLFVTQFLGAFNDNLFKNALVMLVTFRYAAHAPVDPQILVTLAAGIFILPFFLFSATAGQLADKMDRARIARMVKVAEIVFMVVAAAGFLLPSIGTLLVVLFCMGTHSAFFGPVKYAILPQHLEGKDLLAGNGWIEAGTFLAILLGTILGGVLVMHPQGPVLIAAFVIAVAAAGYLTSRLIPPAPGPSPGLTVNLNIFQETGRILAHIRSDAGVYRIVLAISWFWFVGAVYLAQFPAFGKTFLSGDESVVTLLLTLFSVGIGAGSLLCSRLLKGRVEATYVPLAALVMAGFGIDLYFATRHGTGLPEGVLQTAAGFAGHGSGWRVMFDLFMIAVAGGLFVVPLYALVQKRGDALYLARTIAGLNVMNALFMVASSLLTVFLFALSMTIPEVFLVMAAMNVLVAIYIVQLLPDALYRSIARALFRWFWRVEVKGMENFDAAGSRMLIVANHTSFLDAALIAAYLPVKVTFAVNTTIAKKWWIRPLLKIVDAFPVDPANPMAIKALVEVARQDRAVMIFPEGRITVTGSLMKVYEGPGLVADKAGAKVLPIRIDGAQYTPFSRLRGKVTIRRFPKITLTILPPRGFILPEGVFGRVRRQIAAAQLYDVMSSMVFDSSETGRTLLQGLLDAAEVHGSGHVIVEDPERVPMTYGTFIGRAFALGGVLGRNVKTADGAPIQAVGLLLPNMVSTALAFFALHSIGRVPAMLNFSSGPAQIASACATARLVTVITSRRFVEMAKLQGVIEAVAAAGVSFVFLEDMRDSAGWIDKGRGLLARFAPAAVVPRACADDAAVVLFTSGSEGTPKGVVLSHRNIQANRYQISSRVDFGPADIVFNCLPMFHSFGLMGGTLLPILSGIRAFYYPSPLHYRIVPELVYDTNATIMFGTDTFLAGYARFAHPYDFHATRYIFAGAERLKDETRRLYAEKFGVRIFEGYGATETSPVISINTPMHNRAGTVGRILPGMTSRLEPVAGMEPGSGKLLVQGPNIMKGYLRAAAPGVLEPPEEGWYDTGDIVRADADGFISIQGRLKRFAKIGGEMVSLTAVESALQKRWPVAKIGVVSVRDEKKGERLILFTTEAAVRVEDIQAHFRAEGLGELSIPKQIRVVADLPLLGTGKTDYVRLKQMAEEAV